MRHVQSGGGPGYNLVCGIVPRPEHSAIATWAGEKWFSD